MESHWVNGIDESPLEKKIDFEVVNVAQRHLTLALQKSNVIDILQTFYTDITPS